MLNVNQVQNKWYTLSHEKLIKKVEKRFGSLQDKAIRKHKKHLQTLG